MSDLMNELSEALTRAKIAEEAKHWRDAINWNRIAVDRACSVAARAAGQMDYLAYRIVDAAEKSETEE